MKDKGIFLLILLILVGILVIANQVGKAGKACEAKGGDWHKVPGSTKTGYVCELPK